MKNKPRPFYAERLWEASRRAHLTSDELAQMLGVSSGTVRSWWCGRNEPNMAMLYRYAKATGFPIAWFYGEVQPFWNQATTPVPEWYRADWQPCGPEGV